MACLATRWNRSRAVLDKAGVLDKSVEVNRSDALGGVAHGFLGRKGGVSSGLVAGLQVGLGADDDPADVAQNRLLAVQAVLPDAHLVTCYQTHSAKVEIVDQPWDEADRPKADALVTKTKGLVLGIVTADCAPVLLADAQAGIIGAAHAGWRGAHGGVLEATVEAMCAVGASRENIVAAIGPAIAQPSYEVDFNFRAEFLAIEDHFFQPSAIGREDRLQFDLEAYAAWRLKRAGIVKIDGLGLDTYLLEERFYSYRRAIHRSEPTYGRQFSLIGLAT